ncbi:VAN3-binding protein isoform X2 [Rosa chinensis]|uniref:VAN3-binding protein isoform X2 n=1 Tax=Rosa chinensis TaxID=74649 RepID=UPI001AD8D838|nr:VAN3-binding protein isoform X2 [Rosa chinensis]
MNIMMLLHPRFMDSNFSPSPTEAHPDTMDFLSLAWCNFAVQALQPEQQDHQSLVSLSDPIIKFESQNMTQITKLDKNAKMDGADAKPIPPWKSNDVKSWIWMQQAMHPELNYNSYFRKKWLSWKIVPFKNMSIKKWLKEIKERRKEEHRLQRAEVHAAISMAGVAAALAAIAAESSGKNESTAKEGAVASAAALVAAQCAKVAEAMGAKKEQISSVIGSAMSSTSASDILTLTAAAATSLKGAATLKARSGCKNMLHGGAPVLPIEESHEVDFDFEKCRSMLGMGAHLSIETPDGKYTVRSVSVILSSEAKVVLKIRKLSLLKSKQESIILDMHAELYKDSEAETGTGYLIVLTTSKGTFKLDMEDDYQRYTTWATTINHMLMLSTSLSKYHLQFYKN